MSDRLMTKEMCEEFINDGGDIEDVPHIFIDQKMCDNYIELGGIITNVPKRFITLNMCERYIQKGGRLKEIPPKYVNHAVCREYIKYGGLLEEIPDEYVDQLLCKEYIDKGGNIKDVPKKFMTNKLIKSYELQTMYDLKYISEKHITKEMVDKAWELGTDLKYIPEKYITKEMCEKYIEDYGDLKYVPDKYINKKLVSEYMKNDGTVLSVPQKYVTIDMFDNLDNMSKYSRKEKREITKKLLSLVPTEELVKEEIREKYHIDSNTINKVLEKLKETDEEKYNKIIDIFNNSEKSQQYTEYYNDYASEIAKIFESLGPIRKGRLNKDQRIQFSYLYGKSDIKGNIYNIYDFLYDQDKNPEKSRKFMICCKSYLGFKYRNKKTGFSDMDINEEKEFLMESGAKWFNLVDKDEYFTDINGQRKSHYFLDNSDNLVEIKEDDLGIILKYLKTRKIPNCESIVKEACARYVRGELEIFADELTSGNYLEIQKKKQKEEQKKKIK